MDLVNRFIHRYGRLPTEFDPDYWEMLNMSKYRILDVPDLKPGKCANCGSSKNDGRKYVDFGKEVDWYGIIFLCGLCLKDIAFNMGLFKDLEMSLLKSEVENEKLQNLKEKGNVLHESVVQLFKEFEVYYADLHSVGNDSSSNSSSVVRPDEKSVNSGVSGNESSTNTTKRTTTEQTPGSGSEKLPSLAELFNVESS